MIPVCRRIAEILIALVATPLCAQAAASLSAYRCAIVLEPRNRAHVITEIVIDGLGAGASLEFTRIAYPGQSVGGLQFRTDGSFLQWRSTLESVLERYRVAVPANANSAEIAFHQSLEYFVEPAGRDGIAKIPLVVPTVPAPPGRRVVELNIDVGRGMVPVGDTFPRFSWHEKNAGSIVISNVPTFVRVAARPAGGVSLISELWDVTFLNDAAIILFLIAGSVFWWARNRRQKTEAL